MKNNLDPAIDLPERRSNRPITVGHRLEHALVALMFAGFRRLPVDTASSVSGRVLRFLGPYIRPISTRAEDNLRLIFPDWSDERIQETIADVWENLGRVAAEYAHLEKFSINGDDPRILVAGVDDVMPVFETPGRAVFVSGHFANWEISGLCANQLGMPFGVIYRALNNPLVDEMIIKMRARVATRRQIPKGPAGARAMVDLLKEGSSIALLTDQKLNAGGIRVPFMGHEAMTAPAAARIAVRYGLPVVPTSTQRLNGARFKVTIHKPIDFTPSGDFAEDVKALTIRINERLERDIRANPGQWLWFHRRWPKETYNL